MKKKIAYLLILIALNVQAQTIPSYKNIKLTATAENPSATKIYTKEDDNTFGYILKQNLIDVIEVNTASVLPVIGIAEKLYVTKDNNKIYRWNGTFYQELSITDISGKVDKVAGKGLSTEDYTTAEKTKLAGLSNFDPTAINNTLATKVDKVAGKGLSTEDYTTVEKTKLSGIQAGATANSTDAQLRDRATHTGVQPANSITEDADHRFTTDAEKATWNSKQNNLGYTAESISNKVISISESADNTTYPTSLAVKSYADNLVVGMLNDRGTWDASVNAFPATGGSGTAGAIRKGDMWYVSVAGILGGKSVNVGDSFRALVNTPAQIATNWSVLEANIGYVPENVVNKSNSFVTSSSVTYASTKALVDGLASKVSSAGTTSFIPKSSGTNTQVNSSLIDNGLSVVGSLPFLNSNSVSATALIKSGAPASNILLAGGSAVSQNTAFNKPFGTIAETVAEGNDSRILNGQTAFSWGDYRQFGLGLASGGAGVALPSDNLNLTTTPSGSYRTTSITTGIPLGVTNSGSVRISYSVAGYPIQLFQSLGTGLTFPRLFIRNYDSVAMIWKDWEELAKTNSPSFKGTPTAPTAAPGTNTTQIATTAFVAGGLATKENSFSKNTAFNKNFGTTAGTVAEGNDSRILNGHTAFGWGDYRTYGLGLLQSGSRGQQNDFSLAAAEYTSAFGVNGSFFGITNTYRPQGFISKGPLSDRWGWYGITDFGALRMYITNSSNASSYAEVIHSGNIASQNVLSATKLTTPRTINGVSFDGTANITLPDNNTTYTSSNGITLTGTNFTPVYGTTVGTVAEGNDSRINNGQTAFGWGNHATQNYAVKTAPNTFTATQIIDVNIPAPLLVRRLSTNNVNIALQNSVSTKYLGLDSVGDLKWGTLADANLNSKIWHDGNFNPANYLPLSGGAMSGNLGFGISPIQPVHIYKPSGFTTFLAQSGSSYGYFFNNGTNIGIGSNAGTTGYKLLINNSAPDSSLVINSFGDTTFQSSVTASGFFQSSDRRLKYIHKRDGDVAYFTWKDGRDDKMHIGWIAQEVRKQFPDQVQKNEDGYLSVSYIEILVAKNRELEKRLEALEKKSNN